MPIRIDWLVEQHLAFVAVHGETTAEDLRAYDDEAVKILDASPYPLVHTIYDYSAAKSVPPLQETLKMKAGKHPNVGWVLFVKMEHIMMRFILTTASQVFRLRLRTFNTLEEALEFIQAVDSTLPNLQNHSMKDKLQNIRESIFGVKV